MRLFHIDKEDNYGAPWDFKEENSPYRFVEEHAHARPDCHTTMKRVGDLDAAELPCPRCGAPMSRKGDICLD